MGHPVVWAAFEIEILCSLCNASNSFFSISTQQLVGHGSVNENAAVCLKVFSVARKAATPTLTELLRLSVRSPVCLAKKHTMRRKNTQSLRNLRLF